MCYFTGMRVNEASQLTLDEVVLKAYIDEDGNENQVLVFDIGPHNVGQSVKSTYSIRAIPVPQAPLDLGFERYIDDVRASEAEELFPGLNRHQEGGARTTVSGWFNGTHLRETCGITSPRKTLHCFRHNLATLMERNKVADSLIHALNGHASGEGVDRRHYVTDGTVLECQAVLDGLRFPQIAMTPYPSGRFDDYLTHQKAEREREPRARVEGNVFCGRKGRDLSLPRRQEMGRSGLHSAVGYVAVDEIKSLPIPCLMGNDDLQMTLSAASSEPKSFNNLGGTM